MKYHILLSQDEATLLKDYYKTSSFKLIREKAQAISMRDKGFTIEQIRDALFKGKRTISRWIKDFCEVRLASIFSGHVENENASKLTREQKQEAKEALKRPPSEYGIPKEFWSVPRLRSYIEATFGVVYESKRSYHFLLRFCELNFKYPDTFSIKRDIELIEKRMKEIRKEIKPFLEDPEWEVFAADEVRMVLEAETRKAWLRKGERTILKANTKRESQSYFGALCQKTGKCYVYEVNWQNQTQILFALSKLLNKFPNKRICIVWDNARFHQGKLIKQALAKGQLLERVHLINLPPYAPDHNPIEHVWNTVKANLANKQFESFDVTKAMFIREINSRNYEYKI